MLNYDNDKIISQKNKETFYSNNKFEQISNVSDVLIKPINNKHQGCILLSLINKREHKKNSLKTVDTNIFTPVNLDYNLNELEKFDEFNNSLNIISDFDLENYTDDNKSEFNSSENDFSESENEEIIIKTKKIFNKKEDFEYDNELEKDFEEIKKILQINENK